MQQASHFRDFWKVIYDSPQDAVFRPRGCCMYQMRTSIGFGRKPSHQFHWQTEVWRGLKWSMWRASEADHGANAA
eukprot:2578989-Amphidinium_carterae.1